MNEFLEEIIADFIEDTSDENGEPTFVYIPERGIMVNLEVCRDTDLLNAAIDQMRKDMDGLLASLSVCQRRISELESCTRPYRVEWNDHEGHQCERFFDRQEDAFAEAMYLHEKFDFVEVYGPSGQPVEI